MRMKVKRYQPSVLVVALVGLFACGASWGQALDAIIEVEQRRVQAARQAQDRIDQIVDTTRRQFDERQVVLREIDTLVAWNSLMSRQVAAQEQQLRELRTSISQVTVIERQILPLMLRMIDSLEQFIELDMPFFMERRRARVRDLRQLLTRADVTAADQFRLVMEAWQIENDYGRYMDAYTGEITLNGTTREVDFLKVGRVALLYLTPDGREAGAWDPVARDWVTISRDYHDQIRQGFEAYGGDVSKAIFMIPITPPEEGAQQ
jgi:hypothetical protein